jgi:outer membrane receptor for ferrienterochelin and colicins
MGGVVNIITRGAAVEPWALDVDLTAGSQGRAEGAATLAGTRGRLGYTVGGGRRRTELTPGQSEAPGALADRWDGMAKLAWDAGESVRIEGSALVTDERQRWRSGPFYQFADNLEASAQLGLVWTSGAHRVSSLVHWTQFDHLARGATEPEPIRGTGEEESQRQIEAELVYNLALDRFALDVGVEAKQEYALSDRVMDGERTLYSVEPFAQATWTAGALSLVPGARVTWSEQWGSHLSPRLAALYRPTPALALRASVGQGFRAPAFKELYITFLNIGPGYAYTVRGNPELGPEESTNLTAGLEWTVGRGYLRAQAYHNQFDRFIESTFVGDSAGVTVYSYGNVIDGFTRGVEVEGAGSLGPVTVEASYAYLQARESATDLPLLERPEHSARATVDYALPFGLRAALTGLYTGAAPIQRTEEATLERSEFLRFDGRVSQRLPRGVELSLGARNLLNDAPSYWPGFSGRQLYLALGWNAAASSD